MRNNSVVCFIFLFIGLIALWWCLIGIEYGAKEVLNEVEESLYDTTTATVLDTEMITESFGLLSYKQRNIVYEYKVEDTVYRGQYRDDDDSTIIVGDTIEILYSPSDPSYSVLAQSQ